MQPQKTIAFNCSLVTPHKTPHPHKEKKLDKQATKKEKRESG
jgi:hypothetical protein